jgi:hypothetical protein
MLILLCSLTLPSLGKTPKDGESEILLKVINLAIDRIWSVLDKLRDPIQAIAQQAISGVETGDVSLENNEEADFRQWAVNLPVLVSLRSGSTSDHIKWAARARWVYSKQLEALFSANGQDLPSWIKHIYKLARYFSATKAMVTLATKQPNLFISIYVEAVNAPEPVHFRLGNDRLPLKTILHRITKTNPESLMGRLGQIWAQK